jgi:hypothetical protein
MPKGDTTEVMKKSKEKRAWTRAHGSGAAPGAGWQGAGKELAKEVSKKEKKDEKG